MEPQPKCLTTLVIVQLERKKIKCLTPVVILKKMEAKTRKIFNNSSDQTVGNKLVYNIGSDIGGKMEAKSKCLATVAMEPLERKKQSV